jgi:hypothetical protein
MHCIPERVEDHGVSVTKDERTPRQHIVDVLAAVRIPDSRALTSGCNDWISTNSPKRANRGVHSAGKNVARSAKNLR